MGKLIDDTFDKAKRHDFLAQELLQPMTCRTDPGRTNMMISHMSQALVLTNPEPPRVFTRFENQVGQINSAEKFLPDDATIISVFEKNPLQSVYALQYKDGTFDILFTTPYLHLTEAIGYKINRSEILGREVGETLPQGTCIAGWNGIDASGNLCLGTNLRAAYVAERGMTYEDAIVISETASEKLAHHMVNRFRVLIKKDQLLINLFGNFDKNEYKSFPDVGERITDGILLSKRTIESKSSLVTLSDIALSKVDFALDDVIYTNGQVVDIDIYTNLRTEELERHSYWSQISKYVQRWRDLQTWVIEIFKPIVESDAFYTEDVAFWLSRMVSSQALGWKQDNQEFEGVLIDILVADSIPAVNGSKITNRFGGKGVISEIRPDSEMPKDHMGRPLEVLLNTMGVMNRLNPSQLFELELNAIAEVVQEKVRNAYLDDKLDEAWSIHQKFLNKAAPGFAAHLEATLDEESRREYLSELANGSSPIRIHQPPFWDVISLETMKELYEDYWEEGMGVQGTENSIVSGPVYVFKLKHEPAAKLSARSSGKISMGGLPSRDLQRNRDGLTPHSTTPLRLGEQEVGGLLAGASPEAVDKLIRAYSTDSAARESIITTLLTQNPFTGESVTKQDDSISRTRAGMSAYLGSIGLKLESLEKNEID